MEPVNMMLILPECSRYIPRLTSEEPTSTAEGQFVRQLAAPLASTDPFGRCWTLSFIRKPFGELNEWLRDRFSRLGAAEKHRLLNYTQGTKIALDAQVTLQSSELTTKESEPALAAWLVQHMWEMHDHRTGRVIAFIFLNPETEHVLLSGQDYELVSDARSQCFYFKPMAGMPTSSRPLVRFSEGNRCRFWSTHIRFMPALAPEKEMREQAKMIGLLLPMLENGGSSQTDCYIALNMCLDMALAVWRWYECGDATRWRNTTWLTDLFASIQRVLSVARTHTTDAIILDMIRVVQFHAERVKNRL